MMFPLPHADFSSLHAAGMTEIQSEIATMIVTETAIAPAIAIATEAMTAAMTAVDARDRLVDNVALDAILRVTPTLLAETIGSESARIGIGTGVEVIGSGIGTEEIAIAERHVVMMSDPNAAIATSSTTIDVQLVGTVMALEEEQRKDERRAQLHHRRRESPHLISRTLHLSLTGSEGLHSGTLNHPAMSMSAPSQQRCQACSRFPERRDSNL